VLAVVVVIIAIIIAWRVLIFIVIVVVVVVVITIVIAWRVLIVIVAIIVTFSEFVEHGQWLRHGPASLPRDHILQCLVVDELWWYWSTLSRCA